MISTIESILTRPIATVDFVVLAPSHSAVPTMPHVIRGSGDDAPLLASIRTARRATFAASGIRLTEEADLVDMAAWHVVALEKREHSAFLQQPLAVEEHALGGIPEPPMGGFTANLQVFRS